MEPIAHDLVEGFFDVHATAFQLDLDNRQPIRQKRHIVSVGVFPDLGDLMCHLEEILRHVFREETQEDITAIFPLQDELVSQVFRALENALFVQVQQDLFEFFIG